MGGILSYYSNNWFKCSRTLFQEFIDDGNPKDFFVLTTLLLRVRWNGNRHNLEIGQVLMGLDEIGKIVGLSRNGVRGSLKRLEKKVQLRVMSRTASGTVIELLNREAYSDIRDESKDINETQVVHLRSPNIDKTRQNKKKHMSIALSQIEEIKNIYPQRSTPHNWNKGIVKLESQTTFDQSHNLRLMNDFMTACKNYANHCAERQIVGSEFVKMFETFCTQGNWEPWADWRPTNPSVKPGKEGWF